MKIDWEKYKIPYKTNESIIEEQLNYLASTSDGNNEVENFLYTELLENIKHQYRVYSIVMPVIKFFDGIFSKDPEYRYKLEVLNFLGYIFSEFIREENGILTAPMEYEFKAQKLNKSYPDEFVYFKAFKDFYFKHSDKKLFSHTKEEIYYDCALGNSAISFEKKLQVLASTNDGLLNDTYIGLGLLRYKSIEAGKLPVKIESTSKISDAALAINNLPFDETTLIKTLNQIDEFETKSIWATGFLHVISGSSYLISSLTSTFEEQEKVVNNILQSYKTIKKSYENVYDIPFPPHNFLLEDTSSIIFKNELGSGKTLERKNFTPIQKYFVDLLGNEYKVHTYTLLSAGVLPMGIDKEELKNISNIYECYNSV